MTVYVQHLTLDIREGFDSVVVVVVLMASFACHNKYIFNLYCSVYVLIPHNIKSRVVLSECFADFMACVLAN